MLPPKIDWIIPLDGLQINFHQSALNNVKFGPRVAYVKIIINLSNIRKALVVLEIIYTRRIGHTDYQNPKILPEVVET